MRAFLILIIAIVVHELIAWSGSGHVDITWLAWQMLDRRGKRFLRHHFGHDLNSLLRGSTWADSDAAFASYPDSRRLHFSNTPYRQCSPFDLERDCGEKGSKRCIVTGIAEFAAIAVDHSQGVSQRTDAIKFLLHLIADMHQPLHTGFAKDQGGNLIRILDHGDTMSLHEIWDYGLLNMDISDQSIDLNPARISPPTDMRSKEDVVRYASQIVSETSTKYTCKFAYTETSGKYIEDNQALSMEYKLSRKAVAQNLMRIAAYRLAEFISALAQQYFSHLPKLVDFSTPCSMSFENQFACLDGLVEEIDDEKESPRSISETIPLFTKISKTPKLELDDGTYVLDEISAIPPRQYVGGKHVDDILMLRTDGHQFLSARSCFNGFSGRQYFTAISNQGFSVSFRPYNGRGRSTTSNLYVDRDCFLEARLSVEDVEFILKEILLVGNSHKTVMTVREWQLIDTARYADLEGNIKYVFAGSNRLTRIWNRVEYTDQTTPVEPLRFILWSHWQRQDRLERTSVALNTTREKLWERELVGKFKFAQAFKWKENLFFFDPSTFTSNLTAPRRFALHSAVTSLRCILLFVDTALYEGDLTPTIVHILWRIYDRTRKQSQDDPNLFERMGSMVTEIFHLEKAIVEREPRRLQRSIFEEFATFPSRFSNHTLFIQWNLTTAFQQQYSAAALRH